MNRTVRVRKNPALRNKAAKSMEEAFPESTILKKNIEMLMLRFREVQDEVAACMNISQDTFARRMVKPWEFKIGEVERLAARWGLTSGQLTREIQLIAPEAAALPEDAVIISTVRRRK